MSEAEPPKGRKPKFAKKTKIEAREIEALNLRLTGMAYEDIGAKLVPPCTRSAAWKMVDRALEKARTEAADKVRRMEVLRLDRALQKACNHEKSNDPSISLDATKTTLTIAARRAKLLGLDSPVVLNLDKALSEILDVVRSHVPGPVYAQIVADINRLGGDTGDGEGAGEGEAEPADPDAPATH